jgi:hypothetical protein
LIRQSPSNEAKYNALLKVGDDGDPSNSNYGTGERIEFQDKTYPETWTGSMRGRDIWIALSLQIPSGQTLDTREILLQRGCKYSYDPNPYAGDQLVLDSGVAGTPADKWFFTIGGGSYQLPTTKQYNLTDGGLSAGLRDTWIDWLIHYVFQNVTANGPLTEVFYRVGGDSGPWVQPIHDTVTPNLITAADGTDDGGFRLQTGLVRDATNHSFNYILHAGLVIGTTRAAVEAAMYG